MDGFKKCTSRPAPSVCRFLQQNLPTADIGIDKSAILTSSPVAKILVLSASLSHRGVAASSTVNSVKSPTCYRP